MLELEPEDIIKLFHGFEVKPAYLSRFALDLDENLLQTELDLTKTAVVTSPNFPNAGKGLVNMSGTVEKDVSFPYWGQIFLHNQYDSQLHNVNLDENIKCRFIAPLFQPFLSKHLKLYLAGSLSCASTYCNDATFKGLTNTRIKNNCVFEQREFTGNKGLELEVEAFGEFIKEPFEFVCTEAEIGKKKEFLVQY